MQEKLHVGTVIYEDVGLSSLLQVQLSRHNLWGTHSVGRQTSVVD